MNKVLGFNGTQLHPVPREPDNGYRFYVSCDGEIGLRIAPDGLRTLIKGTPTTSANSKDPSNANRKQRYLQFKDAFGFHNPVLVSHAVYLAWSGQPIPPEHQIHHLNGIVTDNRIDNLLCVSISEHFRIADVRQRAIAALLPDGDLRCLPYKRLRYLQDPHGLSDDEFKKELETLRASINS